MPNAKRCSSKAADIHRDSILHVMYPGAVTYGMPAAECLGSGRWENQAYPYFEVAADGSLVGSYVVYGDQDDPFTTPQDCEYATAAAVALLEAIGVFHVDDVM